MRNSPLLFIVSGVLVAMAGFVALSMGDLAGTSEGKSLIAIIGVLACSTMGYGIIRWREDQDDDAAAF